MGVQRGGGASEQTHVGQWGQGPIGSPEQGQRHKCMWGSGARDQQAAPSRGSGASAGVHIHLLALYKQTRSCAFLTEGLIHVILVIYVGIHAGQAPLIRTSKKNAPRPRKMVPACRRCVR